MVLLKSVCEFLLVLLGLCRKSVLENNLKLSKQAGRNKDRDNLASYILSPNIRTDPHSEGFAPRSACSINYGFLIQCSPATEALHNMHVF